MICINPGGTMAARRILRLFQDNIGLRPHGFGGWLDEEHGKKRREDRKLLRSATMLAHQSRAGPDRRPFGILSGDWGEVCAEAAACAPTAAVTAPPSASAASSELAQAARTQRDPRPPCKRLRLLDLPQGGRHGTPSTCLRRSAAQFVRA